MARQAYEGRSHEKPWPGCEQGQAAYGQGKPPAQSGAMKRGESGRVNTWDYGNLKLKHSYDEVGDHVFSRIQVVEWLGPPVIRIDWGTTWRVLGNRVTLRVGDQFMFGPYHVECVEVDSQGCFTLVRRSTQGWLFWKVCQLKGAWAWLRRRWVMTLAVWGLRRWPDQGEEW